MTLAEHPVAGLGPRDRLTLGVLVESLACRRVTIDEWLEIVLLNEPGFERANLETSVSELVASGYVQRVSERPPLYRPTPAGRDAAIGYGALNFVRAEG